ncbi:hypothetical protein ACIOJF_03675 [Glutamicibacter sp. NPDC087831]|uniref:hypothetical protein n=1 Tax=Glutamicibacter sp. NPDC087831 TaxID=3363998 RepID=UPI00382263A3
MSLHLYRVTVHKYPTQDGAPFDEQPEEFWQECIDAYSGDAVAEPLPDFMDWDFGEWIYQEAGYGQAYEYPSNYAGVHIQTDPPMVVPVARRKHWLSRHAATRKAAQLREWGCEVTVEKSKPIEFEDTK